MYGVATQNGVGLGVGNIPTLTSLAYPQMLNAIVLGAFSGGAPGWLYDDSNMSTLFQDAAGTTPVTALEQPVGLQLDLSGRGNHRYQPTSANRPTWSARYNLLLATASLSTQSVTVGAGSYTLYFTGAGSVTLSGAATGTKTAGSNAFTCTAGTLTLTVSGSVLTADLRPADQAVGLLPQYQAVVTATDYDSVGFPAGLRWNGSNSWMQNASVDFRGTNKVSLVVGVRKASDASAGMVCELSATSVSNNGTFALTAPDGGTPTYNFNSTGTVAKFASASGFAAPITNTVTGLGDIAAPLAGIRVNGVAKTSTTTTQGTGNYGNYPAYFGARAGSSLFFNGLTFSNIAIGIALSASQIAAFEAWTNSKCRAY